MILLIIKEFINKLNNNEYNWEDLLYNGKIDNSIIEYIDSYEQNNSMIAMNMQ